MKKLLYSLFLILSILLTSCSTVLNNLPGVYSLDVQQGNIINQEIIDQLRPNMTKRQVIYIMGSSMLVDIFHQKRWDYLYSEQLGGETRKQKRLSLFFDGDHLIGVQGDFRPSTLPVIKQSQTTTVDLPKRNLEKTLWEKITGIFNDDTPIKIKTITDEAADNLQSDVKEISNIASEEHLIITPLEEQEEKPEILEQMKEEE